jgi:hypothetical protein
VENYPNKHILDKNFKNAFLGYIEIFS